jgi:hypothetical protein
MPRISMAGCGCSGPAAAKLVRMNPTMLPAPAPAPIGHTNYYSVGDDAAPAPPPNDTINFSLLGMAAVGAAAYHGYKRNESVGWAVGWAALAGLFPVITVAIAVAEGFGKRKGT